MGAAQVVPDYFFTMMGRYVVMDLIETQLKHFAFFWGIQLKAQIGLWKADGMNKISTNPQLVMWAARRKRGPVVRTRIRHSATMIVKCFLLASNPVQVLRVILSALEAAPHLLKTETNSNLVLTECYNNVSLYLLRLASANPCIRVRNIFSLMLTMHGPTRNKCNSAEQQ